VIDVYVIGSYPNLKIFTHNLLIYSILRFVFLQLGDYFCFSHKRAMFKIKAVKN
jgi:hypothetical protein